MDTITKYSLKKHSGRNGYSEFPDTFMLEAFRDGKRVGYIKWAAMSGEIRMIWVDLSWKRLGIATGLYHTAQGLTAGRIMHSPRRTLEGDAWARHVGGDIPSLHPTYAYNHAMTWQTGAQGQPQKKVPS